MLYSTMQPCFGCTKEIIQAKINTVYYLHAWVYPDANRQKSYADLLSYVPGGVLRVDAEDADAEWAISNLRNK